MGGQSIFRDVGATLVLTKGRNIMAWATCWTRYRVKRVTTSMPMPQVGRSVGLYSPCTRRLAACSSHWSSWRVAAWPACLYDRSLAAQPSDLSDFLLRACLHLWAMAGRDNPRHCDYGFRRIAYVWRRRIVPCRGSGWRRLAAVITAGAATVGRSGGRGIEAVTRDERSKWRSGVVGEKTLTRGVARHGVGCVLRLVESVLIACTSSEHLASRGVWRRTSTDGWRQQANELERRAVGQLSSRLIIPLLISEATSGGGGRCGGGGADVGEILGTGRRWQRGVRLCWLTGGSRCCLTALCLRIPALLGSSLSVMYGAYRYRSSLVCCLIPTAVSWRWTSAHWVRQLVIESVEKITTRLSSVFDGTLHSYIRSLRLRP